MAKVHCKHCGITGNSKCPYCRNVFSTIENVKLDMAETTFGLIAKLGNVDGAKYPTVTIRGYGDDTHLDVLKTIKTLLNQVDDEGLKVLACDHDWVFDDGEVSSIGCGHTNKEA